jgi:23S rRNA pseudouridine2605 synthase
MEELIVAGRISVNGKPAHVGQPVSPADTVRVNGQIVKLRWQQRTPRVVLYHKPQGEIVSRDDPEGRPSVFAHLPKLGSSRWVPSDASTSTAKACCSSRPRANSPTG